MKKNILLIEDEPTIVEIYKTAFEAEGFKINSFKLGEEAIRNLEQAEEKPDLILLDLVLPDMDGIDILKKIKEADKTKDIPVFILTNYSSEDVKKKGLKLKAEEYITKADNTPKEIVKKVKDRLKS